MHSSASQRLRLRHAVSLNKRGVEFMHQKLSKWQTKVPQIIEVNHLNK